MFVVTCNNLLMLYTLRTIIIVQSNEHCFIVVILYNVTKIVFYNTVLYGLLMSLNTIILVVLCVLPLFMC